MKTSHIFVIAVILVIGVVSQVKGCVECYSDGGVPVRGVYTYECMKK